jgi:hypothetical protein
VLTSGDFRLERFEDCLGVDGDFDQIADDATEFLQRGVPAHPEVLAVYLGCGRKASASLGALVRAILPPRCLPLTQIGNPKCTRSSHAADVQIPENGIVVVTEQADLTATEGDRGEVLDVEEISATQMSVASRLPRPQVAGVDLYLNRRVLRACGIEDEPAADVFEMSPDVSDHHVAHTEFGGSVPRFEEPSRQGVLSFW